MMQKVTLKVGVIVVPISNFVRQFCSKQTHYVVITKYVTFPLQ